jgi:hypothetical protein
MLTVPETPALFGASLPVGEPVTLVIEEERFFGWVASASPAHSLACVAIEFTRGSQRVQECIPVGDYPGRLRVGWAAGEVL